VCAALLIDNAQVVIASGYTLNVITNIVAGARIGTLFVEHPERELATARQMASCSRKAAQALLALGPQRRQALLGAIATNLTAAKAQILEANQRDIANARENNLRPALAARLVLDDKKLHTLASGTTQPSPSPNLPSSSWRPPTSIPLRSFRFAHVCVSCRVLCHARVCVCVCVWVAWVACLISPRQE
jgi:hypothetical protein